MWCHDYDDVAFYVAVDDDADNDDDKVLHTTLISWTGWMMDNQVIFSGAGYNNQAKHRQDEYVINFVIL